MPGSVIDYVVLSCLPLLTLVSLVDNSVVC